MNSFDAGRGYFYQRKIELLLVILIIGGCATMAIKIFRGYVDTAWVAYLVGEHEILKVDAMAFHAIHGHWPKDNDGVRRFVDDMGWPLSASFSEEDETVIKAARMENGALHYALTLKKTGRTMKMTMRPAVPAQDIFGPVIWRCTDQPDDLAWKLFGEDKTDVARAIIPRSVR